MASELMTQTTMKTAASHSEYVGALISGERRLVLVAMNPDEPWEAFRNLRRAMRRERANVTTTAIFDAPTPMQHRADVISLESRRRAG